MFVFIVPMGINLTGEGVVGQVGSEFIRQRELRTVEESLRNRYKSKLDQADEESALRFQKEIRSRALQDLVGLYVITSALQKEGFFLTNEELRATIQNLPVFQEEGRFLYSKYLSFLKSQNLSPARFEKDVYKKKLTKNWSQVFNQAVFPNQLEKEKKQARHQYKVNLRYAVFKSHRN